MRRGYSNSGLIEENGTFFGISLGSDFCAEHEWGTKELQEILGIDSKKMGIDGRTISRKNCIKKNSNEQIAHPHAVFSQL